jgi:hypothetical protein
MGDLTELDNPSAEGEDGSHLGSHDLMGTGAARSCGAESGDASTDRETEEWADIEEIFIRIFRVLADIGLALFAIFAMPLMCVMMLYALGGVSIILHMEFDGERAMFGAMLAGSVLYPIVLIFDCRLVGWLSIPVVPLSLWIAWGFVAEMMRDRFGPRWWRVIAIKGLRWVGLTGRPSGTHLKLDSGTRISIRVATVDDGSCAICLGEFEEGEAVTDLPCKHHFHVDCAREWFEVKPQCPYCRRWI